MTTYTSDMLAAEALANLFRDGGAGQSPEAEDIEYVKARISAVLDRLAAKNIVTIPDVEDIEPAYFLNLAELVAIECAPKFGGQKSLEMRDNAEEELRVMVRRSDGRKLRVDPALTPGPASLSLARWSRGG